MPESAAGPVVAAIAALAFGPVAPDGAYAVSPASGPETITGRELLARLEAAMAERLDRRFWARCAARGDLPVQPAPAAARAVAPGLPSLAFTGGQGSGKSTLAALAAARLGHARFSWAAPLRAVVALAWGEVDKEARYPLERLVDGVPAEVLATGREVLQWAGTDAVRERVDGDFWLRAGARLLAAAGPAARWANDDTRFGNEAAALRAAGFRIVRCEAPEAVRRARIAGAFADPGHPSERGWQAIEPDLVLDTAGDPEDAWAALAAWLGEAA